MFCQAFCQGFVEAADASVDFYCLKCKQTTKTVKRRTKNLNKRYKAKHADYE